MSKKFLAEIIMQSADITGVAANRVAGDLVAAIVAQITETGGFTLPSFGTFTAAARPKRTALNPATGEKVTVKPSATVRFKASPALKEAVFASMKKAKRKAVKTV